MASRLSNIFPFLIYVFGTSLFGRLASTQAFPLNASSRITARDDENQGGFVPNFQDLSAVLSLLAADSVEQRLVRSDSTQMLERFSSLWSIFGLVGLARVQLKVAAGLASAERAGVELKGAAGFTIQKTENSSNAWAIGSTDAGPWFDMNQQLLGHAKVTGSAWRKPFVIACAYSQCPPHGRRFQVEIFQHFFLVICTLALACGPLLLLRHGNITLNNIALLLMLSGGFVGGCLLPFLLIHWNDIGVPHISTLFSKTDVIDSEGISTKVGPACCIPGLLVLINLCLGINNVDANACTISNTSPMPLQSCFNLYEHVWHFVTKFQEKQ
jgi:hypothetical protein